MSALRYLSVCSGIEAATVAWEPLGWEPGAFAEVEPSACRVLQHHYGASRPHHMPDPMMADTLKDCLMRQAACDQVRRLRADGAVPNLGDMTKINGADWRGKVDVLVGGTPCQAFSVAGLRGGLGDARGNLTLTFLELANAIEPAFTVWENVPGVLSDKTNAFGCLLGGLVGADDALQNVGGWPDRGVVRGPRRIAAWRVLDAQWFGLAQRRARVFVVACPRNGADPSEVLFERAGVQRHTPPRREAGQGFAGDASRGSHWSGGPHPSLNQSHNIGGVGLSNDVAGAVTARHDGSACSDKGPSVVAFPANLSGTQCAAAENVSPAMGAKNPTAVAFPINTQLGLRGAGTSNSSREGIGLGCEGDPAFTLQSAHGHAVATAMQVRRLTPRECERLQGFPDDYTRIPVRRFAEPRITKNRPEDMWEIIGGVWWLMMADGPRYKMLGNSMATECMQFIGVGIERALDLALRNGVWMAAGEARAAAGV